MDIARQCSFGVEEILGLLSCKYGNQFKRGESNSLVGVSHQFVRVNTSEHGESSQPAHDQTACKDDCQVIVLPLGPYEQKTEAVQVMRATPPEREAGHCS